MMKRACGQCWCCCWHGRWQHWRSACLQAEPGDPVAVPGTADLATEEVVDVPTFLTDEERRLLDWHWANLEYGCSARLSQVSLLLHCQHTPTQLNHACSNTVVQACCRVDQPCVTLARGLALSRASALPKGACHACLAV